MKYLKLFEKFNNFIVYGDYSNENTYKFNNISELINFLRDRYSY